MEAPASLWNQPSSAEYNLYSTAAVERIFGYVSNVSLVELGDINSPLLKALSETAPGTFQHSLQVSILSVAATEKVGGELLSLSERVLSTMTSAK